MAEYGLSRDRLLNKEQKEGISFVDILLIVMLAVLILNVLVQYYWLSPVKVQGTSMNQTLQNLDWLYMDKLKNPERGDVVVFVKKGDVNYIKRIIALEGDELYSDNGVIYLKKKGENDFKALKEDYSYYKKAPFGTYILVGDVIKDIPLTKVGKGKMYVLGDNRWDSSDSRTIGLVDTSKILGIVPDWAIKHKETYGGYLQFVERVNEWFRKLKKG